MARDIDGTLLNRGDVVRRVVDRESFFFEEEREERLFIITRLYSEDEIEVRGSSSVWYSPKFRKVPFVLGCRQE